MTDTNPADSPPDDLAGLIADTTRTIGQIVYTTYAIGMREGLEAAAQICEANIAQLNAVGFHPVPVEVLAELRDQVRVGALSIETPVYQMPGEPAT